MNNSEDIIQKKLSDLTPEQMDRLEEVLDDLQDDGEINGSVRSRASKQEDLGKEKSSKGGRIVKLVFAAIIVVVIAVIAVVILLKPKAHTLISAEALLQDIKGISELSGSIYTYNGVATAYTEDGIEKYYIKYKGTVEVGINFEDVSIKIDEKEKQIIIQLPEFRFLTDPIVDISNAEYIFVKDSYNTETISAEALKIAKADLNQKASADKELFDVAKENVSTLIEALTKPLLGQLEQKYSIVIE